MADIVDLLQIKIEKAKGELPEETLNAISAVDWKAVILEMRTSKGYNFEQLGDLELETELLLCGLLSPADYLKELEKRMRISKVEANELVNDMNRMVFMKIKEELIKNSERKKIFAQSAHRENSQLNTTKDKISAPTPAITPTWEVGINKKDADVLQSAGIEMVKPSVVNIEENVIADAVPEAREEILKKVERPETIHPMLQQKILGSVQTPTVKTEYTFQNISKNSDGLEKPETQTETKKSGYDVDPYRLPPE